MVSLREPEVAVGGNGRLQLDRIVPWHPESPRLYDLEVRVLDRDGRVADRVESYFGLRTIEARDGRVWLNGEPFVERLVLDQPGTLDRVQYDHYVADLVNYLTWMSEPAQTERRSWGIVALFFLTIFFVLALLLKREFWRDVR